MGHEFSEAMTRLMWVPQTGHPWIYLITGDPVDKQTPISVL